MNRPHISRYLLVALALALLVGGGGLSCKLAPDYSGTRYRCDRSGQCPDGFSCVAGYCELQTPPGGTDASVPDLPDVPDGCGAMAMPFNDFESTTVNQRKWSMWADAPLTVAPQDGFLTFTIPEGTAGASAAFYTKLRYRMASSRAFAEIAPLDTQDGTAFEFTLITHDDDRWYIRYEDHSLKFKTEIRGDTLELDSADYVAEEQRFWQLREQDGALYWETSPDAETWTTHATTQIDASEVLVRVMFSIDVNSAPVATTITADDLNGGVENDIPFCPIHVVSDDFDDGQVDLRWNPWDDGTCAVFEQDGQLVFQYAEPGAGDCGYYSLTHYDISQGALVIEAPRADPGALHMYINLDFGNGDDASIEISDGTISGEKEVPGASGPVFSRPFDPEQHRWLRLRGDGGTLYWETSPDGRTWDMQGLHSDPPFVLDDLAIEVGSHSETGAIDNLGNGFDNLNLPPQ